MAREVDSVTDIIQMSCSHLCHRSCGSTAAACRKSLAHADVARKGQDNGGICCQVKRMIGVKVHRYRHKSGEGHHPVQCVVIVYFLFVLESFFLSLTLSNRVSRSASGSRSSNSTNLRSLMVCTKCPGIGGKPGAGRNNANRPSEFPRWADRSETRLAQSVNSRKRPKKT